MIGRDVIAATVALQACAVLVAGCGSKTPDYQSIWTTPGSATTTTEAAPPVPLEEYLVGADVRGVAVDPATLPDLAVSMPTPKGWSKRKSDKLPPTTLVIGKGAEYPSAMLSVMRLEGSDFDVADALQHSTVDANMLPNFNQLDVSYDDFQGFPSAMIQGSHDMEGRRLHSWFRMVIATGAAPAHQRYLVQLTIVTPADKAAAEAADVESIIDGFTVAAK